MHILIGLLGIVAAAGFWIWRARAAADAAGDIMDAANDVRLAARRFGFRRRRDVHPVDSIDDARVAGATVVAALMAEPGEATVERRQVWVVQMQSVFDVTRQEAEELAHLGDWLARQCQTPGLAVPRAARRLSQLAGAEALPDMERMITEIFTRQNGTLPEAVVDGLTDLRSKFRS